MCFTLPTALGNNDIFSTSGYFETTRSFSRLVADDRCRKFILTILHRAYFLPRVYAYLSTSVLIAFLAIAVQRMFLVSDTYTRLSATIVYVVGAMPLR